MIPAHSIFSTLCMCVVCVCVCRNGCYLRIVHGKTVAKRITVVVFMSSTKVLFYVSGFFIVVIIIIIMGVRNEYMGIELVQVNYGLQLPYSGLVRLILLFFYRYVLLYYLNLI